MTSGPKSPTLFEQCHGFFYAPFQLKYKYEGDTANGVTSPPNDAIIWTEKRDSQLAWSHQYFKDLGWWSVRGLNSRPADRAAVVKWLLYYVGKMKETIFPKLRVHIKENNNLPHGKFHQFLFPFSSKFPDLNQFRPICSLYLLMLWKNSEPWLPVLGQISLISMLSKSAPSKCYFPPKMITCTCRFTQAEKRRRRISRQTYVVS